MEQLLIFIHIRIFYNMKTFLISLFVVLTSTIGLRGQIPEIATQYISTYQDIAVSEMHRTGIPASIKLAQGLLESDWGRSQLASEANNHFGIKCGNRWQGGSFFKEDDDYRNGKLINSCFRRYDNPAQSYIDHSDFLSKARYAKLFELDPSDYKGWARGLRAAGYATDRKYPQKLIGIIEKYDLQQYDQMTPNDTDYYAENRIDVPQSMPDEDIVFKDKNSDLEDEEIYQSELFETIEISPSDEDEEASVVYEGQVFHYVKEDETMEDIASMHDIELNKLYARNRMPKGAQPVVGEIIKLKGALRMDSQPKYVRFPVERKSEFLFDEQ